MKRFRSISRTKRIVVVGVTAALTLGIAGGAFAFWTASGTGTGAATTGSATTWSIGQVGPIEYGPLTPIPAGSIVGYSTASPSPVETIAYQVTNTGNSNQYLTSVTISVANSNGSAWSTQANTNLPACNANDFAFVDYNDVVQPVGAPLVDTNPGVVGFTYTVGSAENENGVFQIALVDNGANQNNCQNVTVPLYFVAS
jgi:hypothetical protein